MEELLGTGQISNSPLKPLMKYLNATDALNLAATIGVA
jgi:hypothetical protein